MPEERLDPRRTCLLFFDCSNVFLRDPGSRSPEVHAAVANWQRQLAQARELGMMVAYANHVNRADGADSFPRLADTDYRGNRLALGERQQSANVLTVGSPQVQVVDEIAPEPTDYMIWKHRWNPFFQTHLELSMRSRGIDTVVLNGGSVEVGIAATVYAIQALDFDLVVVSDGCTSTRPACRDALMGQVFPIIARIRTTDQVLAMLA